MFEIKDLLFHCIMENTRDARGLIARSAQHTLKMFTLIEDYMVAPYERMIAEQRVVYGYMVWEN